MIHGAEAIAGIFARIEAEGWRPPGSRLPIERRHSRARRRPIHRCRWPACRLPSRTTSTWPACRQPRVSFLRLHAIGVSGGRLAVDRRGRHSDRKTNLDQFATGLVGTRSPYGACASVFDERYISGGSSSGSAVVVAKGLCAFALGTDTAGSGRVPAAFNALVGLKPTRGLLSTSGVVPAAVRWTACRSSRAAHLMQTLSSAWRSDSTRTTPIRGRRRPAPAPRRGLAARSASAFPATSSCSSSAIQRRPGCTRQPSIGSKRSAAGGSRSTSRRFSTQPHCCIRARGWRSDTRRSAPFSRPIRRTCTRSSVRSSARAEDTRRPMRSPQPTGSRRSSVLRRGNGS